MHIFAHAFQWFHDRRIRSKIFLVYLPLILIPLLVLGYTSSIVYSNATIEKTKKSVADTSFLIQTRLNGIITNAESCAAMLTLNLNKIISLTDLPTDDNYNLQRYTQITNQLAFALLVFPDVESAVLLDTQNQLYGTTPEIEANAEAAFASKLYEETQKTNGRNSWFPMEKRDFLVKQANEPVITLGKKIFNINTGQELGILFLNIRESSLSSVYRTNLGNGEGDYFITDVNGTVVSSLDSQSLLKPVADTELRQWIISNEERTDVQQIAAGKMLLASSTFERLGWRMVSVIPMSQLMAETERIALLILMIGVVCFIFAVSAAGILSKLISNPIIKLSKSMKRFSEGNLNVVMEVNSKDEMGLMASGFNTMNRTISQLLTNIKLEQKKKREYELALIQAQIKPHFLYNTLDVIYALSELGRVKDVQKTTKALADFYRVTLSKGKDSITIEEEMRNVKDYLAIQQIRYSDVFDYTIDVDNAVLKHSILKLTLQPLVENAIYHGLKEKGEMGALVVKAYLEDEWIKLQIIDNGVGMDADKLAEVLQTNESGQAQGMSYGLHNVDHRLRLYFGEDYGLIIDSERGKGTVVTVRIPLDFQGE
ncbi:sensor histidine kinase [Paenibacillus psychroresistens]|uniref:histidine kinase n=1 Tax=Paenibacillus psychroresistens TaxID=1778678 RepID=A0A6B8RSX0_9BACL|nr:sensor histidine kinase [Paenibacillus psychroresistens]QGQ99019.1 sensor histidine kinase [Paenibacillus psychroresistens]